MSEQLIAAAQRFENWMKHQAIPLWQTSGLHPQAGVHYERLLPNGKVDYTADLRLRVQARQIFFYAAAKHYGWCENGAAISRQILQFIQEHAAHPSGDGFIYMLNSQLDIIDGKQDLYDHAFFLLGYAWLFKVSRDPAIIELADKLFTHLDTRFVSPFGGWIEGDHTYSCRRQNPHMHLFEAFLALYDATQNHQWLTRATHIFSLFTTHFYDAEKQVLFEFYEEDWQRCRDTRGDLVEPGHLMEWVWLLDWYSRCTGEDVSQYTNALYKKGLSIGIDKAGLLYDTLTYDGKIIDSRKRLWPMTEFIKASLVQARTGNPQAEALAIKGVDDLFTYFLTTPTAGAYIDQRGANNDIINDYAPASTLYHLIGVVMELADHCLAIK